MEPLRIGVAGSTGRLGRAVLDALEAADGLTAASPLTRGAPLDAFVAACDVVVDFSRPDLLVDLAGACAGVGRPLVSGTTGLDDAAHRALEAAASRIPIVHAPNMSVGVNILTHLVEKASETLGPEWTCEIFDAHHRHKVDAPSGTALRLGGAVERSRGAGSVEYAVEREGETIGFHEVRFSGPGERLVLGHEALDRSLFARGALLAARWVVGKPAGLYGMDEVLGLK